MYGSCVLLGLIAVVRAGYEYLPYEMTLKWVINADTVYFNLSIAVIRTTYIDWWGIGLKSSDGQSDMSDSDIVIITKQGVLSDRWATNNTKPELDSAYGGRNSLTFLFSQVLQGDYVTAWFRKKDTQDDYDLKLEEGATYKVLWAVGKYDSTGDLAQHAIGKRGVEVLTLTNDYVDDGKDDAVLVNAATLLSAGFALLASTV